MLDRRFGGADPLQVPEEPLHLGPPLVLIQLKRHFHRRLAVAGSVLDLRKVGHQLDERLNAFMPAAAGQVGNLLRGGPIEIFRSCPLWVIGPDSRMGYAAASKARASPTWTSGSPKTVTSIGCGVSEGATPMVCGR